MIFIYPALCSKNVDPRIVPAVARALERFYLINISEAFSNGTLRPKSKWQVNKGVYGPLVLEAFVFNAYNKSPDVSGSISELKSDASDIKTILNAAEQYYSVNLPKDFTSYEVDIQQVKLNKLIDSASKKLQTLSYMLSKFRTAGEEYRNKFESVTDAGDRSIIDGNLSKIYDFQEELKDTINNIKSDLDSANFESKRLSNYHVTALQNEKRKSEDEKSEDKAADKKERLRLDKEKEDMEKRERESQAAKPHAGGWQLQEYPGISFEPSIANVDVKVQYVGNPRTDNITNRDSTIKMNVGVKVTPYKVDAEVITNALYDDYFAFGYKQLVIKYWRKAARVAIKAGEKMLRKLTGKNIDALFAHDPIKREILYAPEHGVDASSFKRRIDNNDFYNFTAAIVVLNRDEIKEMDSILTDASSLKRLLKMGWNSFCVLDEIKEEVYFISSVDGGYVHQLPYSYIFSALKMDKTYENIDQLQKHTRVFETNSGSGFPTFAARLLKENLLLASMKQRIENE